MQKRLSLAAVSVLLGLLFLACSGPSIPTNSETAPSADDTPLAQAKARNDAKRAQYQQNLIRYRTEKEQYGKDKVEYAAARKLVTSTIENYSMALRERWYRDLIREFPGTEAANEAQRRLAGSDPKSLSVPPEPKEPAPVFEPNYEPEPTGEEIAREREERTRLTRDAVRKAEQDRQAQEKVQQETSQREVQALSNAYLAVLNSARVKMVETVSVERIGSDIWKATITVDNIWHIRHKQIRLQDAQTLWAAWARIASPTKLDSARITIVDLLGNEVGGSRWLAGSLIWVND